MFHEAGFVLREDGTEARTLAAQAEAFLRERGVSVTYTPDTDPVDLIITFGGDGTLLAGARTAMAAGCPLLGVNLGTVGFLTETEPDQLTACLGKLTKGDYTIEERSLLSVRNAQTGETFLALNDAVITRAGFARLIRVDSAVNGVHHDCFTADGIIVATPTGSTGYSLSAGGPIVEPGMSCMLITPVCAHSLRHSPCVVGFDSEIRLRLCRERKQSAELQIDGLNRGVLGAGDEIVITGAPRKMRLIRLYPYDFFGLMRKKLTEWGSSPA